MTTAKTKDIVKVIGLPGDTIQYDNDTLYINGSNEPYLENYIACFKKKDKLQSTYTEKRFEENENFSANHYYSSSL